MTWESERRPLPAGAKATRRVSIREESQGRPQRAMVTYDPESSSPTIGPWLRSSSMVLPEPYDPSRVEELTLHDLQVPQPAVTLP